MAPFIMTCLLDARQFPVLKHYLHQIQNIKSTAGNKGVLFLLNLPALERRLWCKVLTQQCKVLSQKFGCIGLCRFCCDETETLTGTGIMYLGRADSNARFSHIQFMEAPPACGCRFWSYHDVCRAAIQRYGQ